MVRKFINLLICIISMFISLTCLKFEDNHKKECFPPHIDFKTTLDSNSRSAKFEATEKSNLPITKLIWSFGDNSSNFTGEKPPIHQYPAKTKDTTYNVSLTAINKCQEASIWYKPITIEGCLIAADFDTIVNRNIVTFINKSIPGDKKAVKYLWNFGDGTPPDTSKNPVPHVYTSPGAKIVSLTITSPCGPHTQVKVITIGCFKEIVCNDCIKITDNSWSNKSFSLLSYSGINSVEWDFGDNSAKIRGFTSTNNYLTDGTYIVTATLRNDCKSQNFIIRLTIISPKDEYEAIDIASFSQSDNFHQVLYFKNSIYIVKSDRSFYKSEIKGGGVSFYGVSPGEINNRNKLKRDVLSSTIFNFGDFGLYKWNSNEWGLEVNGIGKIVTDIDCNEIGQHVFTALSPSDGDYYSIIFNPRSQFYYSISEGKNGLTYFKTAKSIYYDGPKLNNFGKDCFNLTLNPISFDMGMISKNGVIVTNSIGLEKQFYSIESLTGSTVGLKKILFDSENHLWLLNAQGKLFKFNLSTFEYKEIWSNNVNDFDVYTNNFVNEVVLAGNHLLKRLIKN